MFISLATRTLALTTVQQVQSARVKCGANNFYVVPMSSQTRACFLFYVAVVRFQPPFFPTVLNFVTVFRL